jgi:hypothetical protein
VVTGTPDWTVLSEMADVFLEAHGLQGHRTREHGTREDGTRERGTRDENTRDNGPGSCGCTCGGCDCPPPGLQGPLSPAARLALERTLLAMSARALSGPEGLAGFLRASLLGRPFNGASMVLDIGSTDDIPGHIRRAVILRDRHCQWPGGCDRPASQCEPHHLRPRADGGATSLQNLHLYCLVHHHHFIHRLGWRIIHHPDGARDAISPSGKIIRSHPPASTGQGPPGQRTRGRPVADSSPPG